jgi:hypothetical protein
MSDASEVLVSEKHALLRLLTDGDEGNDEAA